MKKEEKQKKLDMEILPFTPVRKRFLFFTILSMVVVMFIGAYLTFSSMKKSAKAAHKSVSTQITQKIDESLKVLNSLAALPEYNDPDIPWETKVEKLDKINEYYGYMFICYVDEDIQVYTLGEEPASLAGREHMQKLYSTRENIVTDSFVAGADGKTLNYTVAVPLIKDGVMTGSLFCSIYFDETVKLLKQASSTNGAEALLIGSKGQIMSSTEGLSYGTSYVDVLQEYKLFNMTTDKLEIKMLARKSGSFQSMKSGNLFYTVYGPVKNTNWDVLVTIDFWSLFSTMFPLLLFVSFLLAAISLWLYTFVKRHIFCQAEITKKLLTSIQKMEKRMYNNGVTPKDIDYENLIQLSSGGLRDGLTGVSTRMLFLNQAEKMLKDLSLKNKVSLCFVDLDDLKILNDTYGHSAGDAALKKIGFILRRYEKKYDGIAGRYGGDEFILILRDIESLEELNSVLSELVGELKFNIVENAEEIPVHCSIGACIWKEEETLETLIANADKALYDVKRHKKGAYSLFLNGE